MTSNCLKLKAMIYHNVGLRLSPYTRDVRFLKAYPDDCHVRSSFTFLSVNCCFMFSDAVDRETSRLKSLQCSLYHYVNDIHIDICIQYSVGYLSTEAI